MKRLLSAALALSLLSGTAAVAGPYDHGNRGYSEHHYDRGRHDDTGAAVAVGVGALALFAILASQNNDRRDEAAYERDRGYGPSYDNPGYDNRGYDRGYDRGYNYDNRYSDDDE